MLAPIHLIASLKEDFIVLFIERSFGHEENIIMKFGINKIIDRSGFLSLFNNKRQLIFILLIRKQLRTIKESFN